MNEVIDRLRASKSEGENELHNQGKLCGEEWSQSSAEYHELERLCKCRNDWGQDWDKLFTGHVSGYRCSPVLAIADAILATEEGDAHEEFWKQAIGENWRWLTSNPAFLGGFADGALEVWDQVADQI